MVLINTPHISIRVGASVHYITLQVHDRASWSFHWKEERGGGRNLLHDFQVSEWRKNIKVTNILDICLTQVCEQAVDTKQRSLSGDL